MGGISVGTVVFVEFPYSDLRNKKLRPALILANAEFDDVILCQITSKSYSSKNSIDIKENSFEEGRLIKTSYVRYDKLFTIEKSLIKRTVGKLNKKVMDRILKSVRNLFT